MRFVSIFQGLSVLCLSLALPSFGKEIAVPAPARVDEIKAMLASPEASAFYTPPYAQSAWWAEAGRGLSLASLLAAANALDGTEPPALTRELFDDFRVTGNRASYEKPFAERTARLGVLLYAEGFVRNGRRLPAIEREIEAILSEISWAVPAHVPQGADAARARTQVDLAAAARAWSLATADYLLGDRLSPELRRRLRAEVEERVIRPVARRLREGDDGDFGWIAGNNNWTPICHAGVMGAALLLSGSADEKALFVAAFERHTRAYIDAFGPDGFCDEGIGYWSYGFRHYVLGAELIRLVTGGGLDLMAGEAQRNIARFDTRWEITGGLFPAFGDASPRAKASAVLRDFAILRLGQPGALIGTAPSGDMVHRHPLGAQLYAMPFGLTLNRLREEARSLAAPVKPTPAPRDWFPHGGALILRDTSSGGAGIFAALRGGNNGVSHNHNDLGSYVVTVGSTLVLTDLGADTYVRDTFGPRRYTSGLMNSFGHPVPLVAGQLQKRGADARAVTLRTEFTDLRDTWEMDLTSAYEVPELERLTRTFIYERGAGGGLRILDRVKFSRPRSFGTAIILRPKQAYSLIGEDRLIAEANGQAVEIAWRTPRGRLELTSNPVIGIVPADGPKGYRVGIDLAEEQLEAEIELVITRAAAPPPEPARVLPVSESHPALR